MSNAVGVGLILLMAVPYAVLLGIAYFVGCVWTMITSQILRARQGSGE